MNKKETIVEKLENIFPQATSLFGFLAFSIATFISLGIGYYNIPDKGGKFFCLVFLFITGFLISIWIIIFIFEIAAKIMPWIKCLAIPFIFLANLFKNFYLFVIKILIRGAVEDILSEKNKGQKINFVFQKQDNDDHYYQEIFNLEKENINLEIKPDKDNYWRIGFKFSNDGLFPNARHGISMPLFHLAKGEQERNGINIIIKNKNKLNYTFYDSLDSRMNEELLKNYKKDLVTMKVLYNSEGTRVIIFDKDENKLTEKEIGNFRFCQLFAWGDGAEFKIYTKILREAK